MGWPVARPGTDMGETQTPAFDGAVATRHRLD